MSGSPSTSCTFRDFPVNPNMPLKEGDDIEQLEGKVVHKVTHWCLDITEEAAAHAAIRYILSLNCCGQINFDHGGDPNIVALRRIGIIEHRGFKDYGYGGCLYVILNPGFTELPGCSPVHDLIFER